MMKAGQPGAGRRHVLQPRTILMLAIGIFVGYLLGTVIMETADSMMSTRIEHKLNAGSGPATSAVTAVLVAGAATTGSTASSAAVAIGKPAGDTIHSLLTSNGSPYQNFQGRIMYGTYKLAQAMPGGEKLTGFTRIMHRTKDDECMLEIPTFRAKPLHPECDGYCDFPVADRANAVQQWIDAVGANPALLKGAWILLLECDYVMMKPIKAPDAYSDAPARQFHFQYIDTSYPTVVPILDKMLMEKKNITLPHGSIPNSGPAPVLMRFAELKAVTPDWEIFTKAIEDTPKAVEVLGWVREMYAWSIAVALQPKIKILTELATETPLIVQPPADQVFHNAAFCHYTWGATYINSTDGQVWKWDKREYTEPKYALKVPQIPMPPHPFQPNTWRLQDKMPVTADLHATMEAMIGRMNEAIATLPDLTPKA
mmetsp:Transcript_4490/g.7562  ORF Transcript_4490/g.7562 Transcript_4490/m.7562 type:complete len:426 (-) Transcript_4490:524-1801(-)